MLRRTAAVGIFSVVVLGSAAVTSQASIPNCSSNESQRVEAGAAGPIVCLSKGIKTVWVARRTTLPLSSMHVNVVSTRLTKTLAIKSYGTTISHATAQGEFAVVTLRIENNTTKPQSFGDIEQAELEIKSDDFSISTNGDDSDSRAQAFDNEIEPGEFATGDVVFDVSNSSAAEFPQHAGLLLVNFGDDVSFGRVSEVGVVYLGTS